MPILFESRGSLATLWTVSVLSASSVVRASLGGSPSNIEEDGSLSLLQVPHQFLRLRVNQSSRSPIFEDDFTPWGFDLTGMDPKFKFSEDFNKAMNGEWLKRTEIPEGHSSVGYFLNIVKTIEDDVVRIINAGRQDKKAYSVFYDSWMKTVQIEKLNDQPIQPLINKIDGFNDLSQFAELAGHNQYHFGPALFSLDVGPDARNPKKNTLGLGQSGLAMPLEYYLAESHENIREKYQDYIVKMLSLSHWKPKNDNLQETAKAVLEFETRIARVSWKPAELRQAEKTYNPMTLDDLKDKCKGFAWDAFFKGALGEENMDKAKFMIVSAYSAEDVTRGIPAIAEESAKASIEVMKAYYILHTYHQSSKYLSNTFNDLTFEFFGKVLGGIEKQDERGTRGIALTRRFFGTDIGAVYAGEKYTPQMDADMSKMTKLVKRAFRNRVKKLEWMSDATKDKLYEKLEAFEFQIGQPPKPRPEKKIDVNEDTLVQNVVASQVWDWNHQIDQIGEDVERGWWEMAAIDVNAYYDPTQNKIVCTVGIMQPPFYNEKADTSQNYGGIVAVLGHELTHGFDDQGRKFDKDGKMEQWWEDADIEKFDELKKKFITQLEEFKYPETEAGMDIKVNGQLIIGESMADSGGLAIANDAYQLLLEEDPSAVKFTNERWLVDDGDEAKERQRRLHASWAQIWREKMTKEAAKLRSESDPHPLAPQRVETPRNNDHFFEAFGIVEGDKMWRAPKDRVLIW